MNWMTATSMAGDKRIDRRDRDPVVEIKPAAPVLVKSPAAAGAVERQPVNCPSERIIDFTQPLHHGSLVGLRSPCFSIRRSKLLTAYAGSLNPGGRLPDTI